MNNIQHSLKIKLNDEKVNVQNIVNEIKNICNYYMEITIENNNIINLDCYTRGLILEELVKILENLNCSIKGIVYDPTMCSYFMEIEELEMINGKMINYKSKHYDDNVKLFYDKNGLDYTQSREYLEELIQ